MYGLLTYRQRLQLSIFAPLAKETHHSIGVGRFIGGGRFRILGGAKGGQIPSRYMTS